MHGRHSITKCDPSFYAGLWLGGDPEGGEQLVARATTVVKARSIRRYTYNERFDIELVQRSSRCLGIDDETVHSIRRSLQVGTIPPVCPRHISITTTSIHHYHRRMSLLSQKWQYNLHHVFQDHTCNVHSDILIHPWCLRQLQVHNEKKYMTQRVIYYTD